MLPQVDYKAGRATAPVPGVVFELEHGVGLIILRPSGVLWTNQVGGTGCEHPYVEGIYVPLGGGDSTEQCLLGDRKSTRLNSSHIQKSRMPSSA